MKVSVKSIAFNGIIAAIYVVLTIVTAPFSYGQIQFRVAEMLCILCFFRKDAVIGLTAGCLIANIGSSVGAIDMLFGTAATLIACLGMAFCKQLLVAIFLPIVVNAFVVGAELYFFLELPFWANVMWVGIGESAVLIVGYIIMLCIKKKTKFYEVIGAKQNIDFKF